ncbi:MAG: hypothetical protein HZB91_08225 [Elusimicrobia bacterium]|nr:hypothetical protein [Elusimicrobiota bacterium]
MEEREIVIRIRFGRGQARGILAACLVCLCAAELGSESLTMTTYYPSPAGVYQRLTTTGVTLLARDGGRVGVGTTNPNGALDVESTTAGFLPPRMNTTQRDAITTEGALIYTTDTQDLNLRLRQGWRPMSALVATVSFAALKEYVGSCGAGDDWNELACLAACNRYCTDSAAGRLFKGGVMADVTGSAVKCLCVP